MKGDERTKQIPVVILTYSKENPDIKACYALSINGYIVKPVKFNAFLKAVETLGLYWAVLNQPPL
ncbi:hypothetical protein H8E50_02445 [bacterium]|nr:hypothetical protein [bacterium]